MKLPRYAKRILQGIVVLFLALLLIVIFLPSFLGAQRVQNILIARVNDALDEGQEIGWGRMSLRWFGAQRIDDLVFRDAGMTLSVDSISIEKGILSWVGRSVNVGEVRLERPAVRIVLPAKAAPVDAPADAYTYPTLLRGHDEQKDIVAGDTSRPPIERDAQPFQLPIDVLGALHVHNGSIGIRDTEGPQELRWNDISLHAGFANGLRDTVTIQAAASTTHEQGVGRIRLQGTLRMLQPDGSLNLQDILVDAEFTVEDLDIGAMAWLPHERMDAPMAHGLVRASLVLHASGVEHVSVAYDISINDLLLDGGPLQDDRLQIGDVSLQAKANWQEQHLLVETLALTNDLVRLAGDGSIRVQADKQYPAGRFQVSVVGDVARAVSQLPSLIPLHDGVGLEEGMLALDVSFESDGEALQLAGSMALPHMRIRHDEQTVQLDEIIAAEVKLTYAASVPVLDRLRIKTPFAHAEAQGTPEAFTLQVDIDLDAAVETAQQFIAMEAYTLSGRAALSADLESIAPETSSLRLAFTSPGARIGLSAEQIIALEEMSLDVQSDIHFGADGFTPYRLSGLRGLFQSVPLQASLTVTELDLTTDVPMLSAGSAQWAVDFAAVQDILAAAGIWEEGISMAGQFRGGAGIALQNGTLSISPFEGRVSDLRFETPDISFADPEVVIKLELALDMPPHALGITLREGTLESKTFKVVLPEVVFSVPEGTVPLMKVSEALLTADVGGLMPMVQKATGAPIEMDGESTVLFSWQGPVDADWEQAVRQSIGDAEIRLPRIKAYGMLASNVVATMQARDGRVLLALDTAANDGRIALEPFVDVTGDEALLVIPDGTHVIQDVTLNDEMANELLGLVHPLLRGSSVLGGIVNLTLDTCRIPLAENGVQGAELRGTFVLRDVEIAAQGSLLRIFETARLRAQRVHLPEQTIAFYVSEGRIYPAPLDLRASGHTITFSGSVGLDSSLDYRVLVPLSVELVGREAYQLLEGQTLSLAIGGTAMRPELARDAFVQAVSALVRDALRGAVREEGREAVRELQERGEEALRDLLRRHR